MTNRQYRRWRVTAQSTWKKIGGEHRGCLSVQELSPCGVGVPLRCWRDLQSLEDAADGGRADLVAEFEEFALDPLVSPSAVLGGETSDQRGDLCTDWWPACAVRIGPFPGDQTAVPPQDCSRSHQAVCAQPCRQVPDQRGHDGPVSPVEAGPGVGAAQHGDFMPQDEQFCVLGC